MCPGQEEEKLIFYLNFAEFRAWFTPHQFISLLEDGTQDHCLILILVFPGSSKF